MLFLSSNLVRIPVYTRSFEARKYSGKIRIGIRLRSCTNLSVKNKLALLTDVVHFPKLLYEKATQNMNSSVATKQISRRPIII